MSNGAYLGHWDGSSWAHVDSANGGILAGGAPGDWWRLGSAPNYLTAQDSGSVATIPFTHHEPTAVGCSADAAATAGSQLHFDYTLPSGSTCCFLLDGTGCGSFAPSVGASAQDCSLQPGVAKPLSSGWASATDDVWFVGIHAFRYDGTHWTCPNLPTSSYLRSVWGSSRKDVWAVGDAGTILHFDGTRWSSMPSPTTASLSGVWASGRCDVWAIGDGVYHAKPASGSTADGNAD